MCWMFVFYILWTMLWDVVSMVVAEQTACASVRQSWMQKHSLGRGFSEHGNWVGFLCAMLCTDLSNSNQKIDCTTFSPSWPSSYMDCFVRKWRWGMPTFNLSSTIYITQISSGVSASLEKKANCIAPAQVSALSVTINWYVCIWFASCHQKL